MVWAANQINVGNSMPGTDWKSAGTVKYIPELFSMKVMKLFSEAILLNEVTNNDYEGDIKGKGDKVNIRVAPTYLNVRTYDPGNISDSDASDITYENPDAQARSLLIDKAVYTAFTIDDVDEGQSDVDMMGRFAETAAYSLARDTSKLVLAAMGQGAHASNKGLTAGKLTSSYSLGTEAAPLIVDATNALEKIVDLGTVLDEFDVPIEGRFIVLPAWYCNYLKKGDLKRADITGDGTGVIRTGLIGQIDNFLVYKSNLLYSFTADVTTPDTVTGFDILCGVKDATTFASQVTKTETNRAEKTFGDNWRSLMVYGHKVIQPEALAVMKATPTSWV